MEEIKVSVPVVAYKHAKYIRQCLDSILMQKVNFKYEIVVGEDCSEDGTREILLEYQEKHPDKFVLLLNEKNMGAAANGRNVRQHCRGQYLSGCEGDDFWLDENKLQKQADFLDTHPEYTAIASNTLNVDHDGNNPRLALMRWQVGKTYTLKHYLRYGMVIHGNSMMRRNYNLYADERYCQLVSAESTMTDVINRVVLYDTGKLYVLPDITHAHRDGASDKTSFTAQSKEKSIEMTEMYLRIVNNLTKYFDGKYNLEALKANRLAGTLVGRIFGTNHMDMRAFWALWREQTWKVRLLSLERCVQKIVRVAFRVVGRKLHLYTK